MGPKKRENGGSIGQNMVPIAQKYPSVFKMGSKSKIGPKLEFLEPNYDFLKMLRFAQNPPPKMGRNFKSAKHCRVVQKNRNIQFSVLVRKIILGRPRIIWESLEHIPQVFGELEPIS